jgi:hypothetical protein
MAKEDQLKFVNIAVTGEGLYGLTGTGDVWQFDPSSHLWKPLPMISATGMSSTKPAA